MPTLAIPLGLLALLGILAVLAIHYLQRKARELPVSTLFLLDHTRRRWHPSDSLHSEARIRSPSIQQ